MSKPSPKYTITVMSAGYRAPHTLFDPSLKTPPHAAAAFPESEASSRVDREGDRR